MKAICECKFNHLLNEAKDASKLLGLDFADVIESLSIYVIKCYKIIFQIKYFIKCYGGFICIILIIIQTIFVILAIQISMYKIRKATFSLLDSYSSLLISRNHIQFPPKKSSRKLKNLINNDNKIINSEAKFKNSEIAFKTTLKSPKNIIKVKKNKVKLKHLKERKTTKSLRFNNSKKSISVSNIQLNNNINLEEYLKTSMDELDYEQIIEREKRNFFKIFIDKE